MRGEGGRGEGSKSDKGGVKVTYLLMDKYNNGKRDKGST